MGPQDSLGDDSWMGVFPERVISQQKRKSAKEYRVLVIEGQTRDFILLREHLQEADVGVSFELAQAKRLSEGLEQLAKGGIDVVMLDLNLPDSSGIETIQRAIAQAPHVPIIVLTGFDDESLAIEAVGEGAQDYLVKGDWSGDSLVRSLRYCLVRHKTQEKLRDALQQAEASAERFHSVSESANDAIITINSSGEIISWNQGARTIFGYADEEVEGRPATILMPDRYRESHTQALQRHVQNGESHVIGKTVELHGLRKDATEFPLELSLSTWTSAEGQFYSGIIRDITERKRAAEELRSVIEAAPVGMMLVDHELNITLVNSEIENMFSYPRKELLGQSIEILVPEYARETHPGYAAEFMANPRFRKADASSGIYGLRKDRQEIPLEIALNPIQLENRLAILCVIVDISERKKVLDRVVAIVESSPDAILLVDDEGKIGIVNSETEEMFGYAREELVGQLIELLVPEDIREKHVEYRETFVAENRSRPFGVHLELRGRHKDGTIFPVEVGLKPIELEKRTFVITTIRDITERKRIEREFAIARQIQQALLPKSAPSLPGFDIAGISHPADETGGDFFDYLSLPNGQLNIVLGDVSGHGLGPALLVAQTQAQLRALAESHDDVGEVLTRANRLFRGAGPGRFVTMLLACIDVKTRSFTYASAGHRGYLLNTIGDVRILDSTGMAVGIDEDEVISSQPAIALTAGDLIVLTTDGIEEAISPSKTLFGVKNTLEVIRENHERPATEIVHALCKAPRDFTEGGQQRDDMTAVVIKVLETP